MPAAYTTARCPNCFTHFEGVPLEADEDGRAYFDLDESKCAEHGCEVWLCANCDQFQCDGCAKHFCLSHVVIVPDGTPHPLKCCKGCAAECEEMPAPIGPGVERETWRKAAA